LDYMGRSVAMTNAIDSSLTDDVTGATITPRDARGRLAAT